MRKAISWKRTTALATCTLMFAAAAAGSLATMDFGHASADDENQYTISTANGMQEFDGWGLSLSWWATEVGDWTRVGSSGMTKREELLEALYGESGLNLNIARYNVGGGDDPAHNPEDDPDKAHMSPDRNTPGWRGASEQVLDDGNGNEYTARVIDDRYAFQDENGNDIPWEETPDWKQLWALDWIQKEHGTDGQNDLITEYYSNSPPYWMTISGCSSGGAGAGQNLLDDEEHNQAFVDYFLDVYEYLIRQGFVLENLQPFNESGSYYWGTNGDQEGCYFSPQQKVNVLGLLIQELQERDLNSKYGIDVKYNIGDETNTNVARDQYNSMRSATSQMSDGTSGADILNGASRITYHIYDRQTGSMQEMYRNAMSRGQEVYMSEVSYSDKADDGTNEYDANSLTTGFDYTSGIIDTIKNGGVGAYVFWQGMEDMVGQMKGNTNWGLIQGVYYTQEQAEAQGVDLAAMGLNYQDFVCAKAYYMSGQYTKYIRPGYQILDVDDSKALAAISPEGDTLVIVRENNDSNSKSLRYDLDGFEVQSIEKIVTDRNNNWAHSRISVTGNSVVDSVTDHSVTTYVVHGRRTKTTGQFVDDSSFVEKGSIDNSSTAEGNLASLKSALEEGGETEELFYASGFHTNGNSSGEAKFYGNTIWANEKGYLGFRFQGTGFGIVATTKNDTGKIDYWFDADPAEEPTGTQDMYGNGGTKTQNVLYVVNDPEYEYGWHTVYIKIGQGDHGQYLNVDGIRIFTAHDAEASEKTLKLDSAAGIGGEIKFTYTVEGYDGYTVYPEYLDGADWTRGAALDIAETDGTITGIEGTTVRLRLVAVKGDETEYSGERIVRMAKTTEGVLYYADCGTLDPGALAPGAVLGELQSVSDQAYGIDPASGRQWGYKHELKDGTSAGYYAESEAMTSIWNSKDNTTGLELTYEFEIPEAGSYNVAVGFFGGGSGWGERQHTVDINGQQDTATVNEQAYTAVFKTITLEASGTITVKVTSTADAALLSAIVITKAEVAIPLYAEGGSNISSSAFAASKKIVINSDIAESLANDTYALTLSDGTTVDYKVGEEGISYTLSSAMIGYGLRADLTLTHEEYPGIELYGIYTWDQEGVAPLYYNIDVGYIGDNPPEDAAGNIGAKQSTTKDRNFGADGDKGSWGRFDDGLNTPLTKDNCYWETDADPTQSMGEEKLSGDLRYKMTGFDANEALKIEVGGRCHDWGGRTFAIYANENNVGSMTLVNNEKSVVKDVKVTANASGELVLRFHSTQGGNPLVTYIKVWKDAEGIPQDKAITTDKTIVSLDDEITLRDLDEAGYVYVLDENGTIISQFQPEGATQTLNVGELLAGRTAAELQFVQAADGKMASEAVTVGVLDVKVIIDEAFVPDGDSAVVRFSPQTSGSITSLTLTTPDGVNFNILEGFYYRAKTNGEYTVTIVSGNVSLSKTFTVETIDELDLHATFSTEGWTNGDVTVTLAPTATSGIVSVKIGTEEKNSFTATENGEYPVTVKTKAGFTYERTVTVANIDKAAPELELSLKLTANGVGVNYSATSVSGGKLYVGFNGGAEREVTEQEGLNFDAEGKYEIYFKNSLGTSTDRFVYYVTYGADKAHLASVSIGDDGTVTVTEQARAALTSTLYRAGESAAIGSLKAEKAGKYYLDLDNGIEHELLVFYVRSAAMGGGTGTSDVVGGSGGNMDGLMYGGIAIGAAAIVAGALACGLIIMRRRKNR